MRSWVAMEATTGAGATADGAGAGAAGVMVVDQLAMAGGRLAGGAGSVAGARLLVVTSAAVIGGDTFFAALARMALGRQRPSSLMP